LGVSDPWAAVFVGDRLHDDVFGARSAGLRAVWRRSLKVPGYDVEAHAVIDSLPELLSVVNQW
jgi:putative hydrolase of the HAD superfamily